MPMPIIAFPVNIGKSYNKLDTHGHYNKVIFFFQILVIIRAY